jgi:ABC-type branched-subunit amino acid transport system ATPase component
LETCGIPGLADADPTSLAYGTQRLVEIARAISSGPELLLLDEPTAGMNDTERHEIETVQLELRDRGITQLLVEHHMAMIGRLCSQVFVLGSGALIASGTPAEIMSEPVVREAYLGARA